MNTAPLGKTELQVSKIGLGTVEIGIPYGIGNTGLPSEQEAITILKTAVEVGITYIDTARGYGLAEERIGKSEITKNPNIIVGTKCGQFLKDSPELSFNELEARIREEVDISRKNLNQEVLQLVQFHNEREDYTELSPIVEIFQKLIHEQKILHVGIAVRGEDVGNSALSTGFFETMQLAYSIADQRMAAHVIPKAHEQGIGIINRSVLLKGALTSGRTKLPPALMPLQNIGDAAEMLANELRISLPELAIRFAISNPAISTVLLGTTKPHHLESALQATEAGALPSEIIHKLYALGSIDPAQIDPSKWPKVD